MTDDVTTRIPEAEPRSGQREQPSRLREPVVTRREIAVPPPAGGQLEDPVAAQLEELGHGGLTTAPAESSPDVDPVLAAVVPPSRVGMLLVGVVATVALVAIAWLYVGGDPNEPPGVAVAPASAGSRGTTPATREDTSSRAAVLPSAPVAPPSRPAASSDPTAGERAPPPPKTPASPPPPESAGDPEGELDQAQAKSPEDAEAKSLIERIAEALDQRRIRALDNMLFFRSKNDQDVGYAEAVALCRAARINRIRGWRVPTILELRKLRKARIIPRRGSFWSRSSAADDTIEGEAYWTLSRSSHRPAAKPAVEAAAQTVCVRQR